MAKNKWGWGPFSPAASVLAATSPAQVPSTSTAIDAATGGVTVSWAAPAALGGVPVLSYLIEIRGGDSVWRTDAACDGTSSPVLSGRTCLIPMASLAAAGSHALAFDALVAVRVSAANVRGYGPASSPNSSGARIRQVPAVMSAPTKGAATSDSQVEVLWSAVTAAGLPTGNSAVLSYQLLWDNGQPARTDFLLLAQTTALGFTLVGVTEGATYRFQIRAVNIYGAGQASPAAPIRASDIPSRMASPSTVRAGTDIVVSWDPPASNGAALSAYEISVFSRATSAYVVDTSACDGSGAGVFAARLCAWPIAYLRSAYAYEVGALVLFRARARNDEGWGELSNPNAGGATVQTVPVAMGAPGEGSATTDTQIELTWAALATVSSSGGATITSYALEWDEGTGSGNFLVLQGDPTPDTSTGYLLTAGLTPGAAYLFRLRASNALGWGAYGPTTSVTPSTVPAGVAAPTTAASSVYAQVSWAAPGDNGAAVTAYRVLVRKGDGGLTEDLTYCDGADPAVRAAGYCLIPMAALRAAPYSLPAGALVAAQVQAANLKGWGALSPLNTAGAVCETEPVAPAAPTRVEASTDDTRVTVSWPALTTDAERGGPSATVTSYELQWVAGASGGTWAAHSGVSPLSTLTTRTASPVLAGQVYRFRVRAKNKYGWGPPGPETAVYAADVPEAPVAPTTAQAALDVAIAWVPPDANGLAIDAYEVLVLESDGATWTAAAGCDGSEPGIVAAARCDVPMATLRAAPFALVLNDPVIAKVRAHNLLGWSLAYSPPTVTGATIKTEPGAPPAAPTEGPATDDTQIQVEWAAVTGDAAGQDPVTLYEVYWDAGSSGSSWPLLVLQSSGHFTFTFTQASGVSPGAAYQFRYRASNQHGTGDWSPTATLYASAPPLALAAATTSNEGTDVRVTWPATPSDRGSAVTAYSVTFKRADGTYSPIVPGCDGTLSAVASSRSCAVPMATLTAAPFSLAIGSTVVARVSASNAKGASPLSPANTAGAVAQAAPTAGPAAARGGATTATQIEVTWPPIATSPADGGATITSYELYWDGATGDAPALWPLVATVAAGSPTYSVTAGPGLTTGATYQFAVKAVNVHGAGPLGATLSVLAAGVPSSPSGLVLSSASSVSITFTWTAPADSGGVPITGYTIYWN